MAVTWGHMLSGGDLVVLEVKGNTWAHCAVTCHYSALLGTIPNTVSVQT